MIAVFALAACSASAGSAGSDAGGSDTGAGGSRDGRDGQDGSGGNTDAALAIEVLGSCVTGQVAASLDLTIKQLSAELAGTAPGDESRIESVIGKETLRIARDICELRDLAVGDGNSGSGGAADGRPGGGSDSVIVSPESDRDASLPNSLVEAPQRFDPSDTPPGTDATLDQLWLTCGDGEWLACDRLLYESPANSDYEAFGFSCGGRANLDCGSLLGGKSSTGSTFNSQPVSPATPAPGDISSLDGWWVRCSNGSAQACAQLVLIAPSGSVYAFYGYSCGGRVAGDCASLLGDDGSPPALSTRSPNDPAPGTDAYLDGLWRRCADLSAVACGDLATFAPPSSDYERFALSCGWRAVTPCTRLFLQIQALSQ